MSDGPTILFTVFEHSGDMLAAQVVSNLLVRCPSAQVYAFGGPRVRDAGAQLIGEADMGRSIVGFGKGLAEASAGLRLRYEFSRQFAPYIGVERAGSFGQTADYVRASGGRPLQTRWVAGVRFWF